MTRVRVYSALVSIAFLISGCTAGSLSEAEQQSLAAAAVAAPKLQPGDKIRINVFGEDNLSGDYEIDQSGQISLPLAGTIAAVGLTQTELEQALAKKFRSEYLKNPKVTVTIATLRPFYMMGEVDEARRISLQERAQCAHRNGNSWGAYLSSKPLYSSDSAPRRKQHARLSFVGFGPNLTR